MLTKQQLNALRYIEEATAEIESRARRINDYIALAHLPLHQIRISDRTNPLKEQAALLHLEHTHTDELHNEKTRL